MPRLLYEVDLTAPPLELAAQALAIHRVQEFARRNQLLIEEREEAYHRDFLLAIPADRMNDVL